jgi:hypothetical protein
MGWASTKNRHMPCIQNYASAKAKWENTTPIRGYSQDSDRPLHDRSDRNRLIAKSGDTFAARLYNTEVVQYLPNGDVILNTGGWNSHATADFMNAVSPVQAELFDGSVWARFRNSACYVVRNMLRIRQDDKGIWYPVAPVPTVTYQLNKEKCKQIRTSFKPFVAYADAMIKLEGKKKNEWHSASVFDLADEGTYHGLYSTIQARDMKSFRSNLWNWAYKQYECWETIDVPLGEQVRQYPK